MKVYGKRKNPPLPLFPPLFPSSLSPLSPSPLSLPCPSPALRPLPYPRPLSILLRLFPLCFRLSPPPFCASSPLSDLPSSPQGSGNGERASIILLGLYYSPISATPPTCPTLQHILLQHIPLTDMYYFTILLHTIFYSTIGAY